MSRGGFCVKRFTGEGGTGPVGAGRHRQARLDTRHPGTCNWPNSLADPFMSSPQKRDPAATRRTILEAAEALILAKGFSATTVSEIAKQAGVTKSLIHHHFGSKEALWSAVKLLKFEDYHQRQVGMLRDSSNKENLLRDSIVAYFRFLQAHPEVTRLMAWVSLEGETPCAEEQKELFELALHRLEEAQAAGLLRRDVRPAFILISFLSLVQGWFRAHSAEEMALLDLADDAATDDDYLDALLKLFFEGALPR